MNPVFIYTLNCPITGEVRYVGKTSNSARRYSEHLSSKEKNHKGNWIHSLLVGGRKPTLETLDETTEEFSGPLEAAYIQFFREEGFALVNATSGGEGVEQTPEILAKKSVAMSGEKNPSFGKSPSAETRMKQSASSLGRLISIETKAKMSAWQVGRKLSSESRAKMSASGKIKIFSSEHRAKISASLAGNKRALGSKHSPESRAKISAASKAYQAAKKAAA